MLRGGLLFTGLEIKYNLIMVTFGSGVFLIKSDREYTPL
jgi:hypothetical protein